MATQRTGSSNAGTGAGQHALVIEGVDPNPKKSLLERIIRGDIVRRFFDISASLFLIATLSPILALSALAIRMTSKGPALFRQPRIGLHGSEFSIFKFRTMYTDAERIVAKDGTLTKSGRFDPRVTPVGRFLRRWSIDELPQLFNVLNGDMSLIGPRPVVPEMWHPFAATNRARTVVRPGITGLWQVKARHMNTSVADMLPYDLEYVEKRSILLDVRILFATVFVVFGGKGAE